MLADRLSPRTAQRLRAGLRLAKDFGPATDGTGGAERNDHTVFGGNAAEGIWRIAELAVHAPGDCNMAGAELAELAPMREQRGFDAVPVHVGAGRPLAVAAWRRAVGARGLVAAIDLHAARRE